MRHFAAILLLVAPILPSTALAGSGAAAPVKKSLHDSVYVAGDLLNTPRVFFAVSKAILTNEAVDSLVPVRDFLLQHPEIRIEIGAHTVQRGDMVYAQESSQSRAEACRDQLLSWHVPAKQIACKGYGRTKPMYSDSLIKSQSSEGARARMGTANSRVEFTVVRIERTLHDSVFRAGDVIALPPIPFSAESPIIRDKPAIDTIADFLQRHTQLVVTIRSHTDSHGGGVNNLQASEARARMIYEYLIQEKHIPKERLAFAGCGEHELLVSDDVIKKANPEEKETLESINRRTELLVVIGNGGQ